MKIALSLAALMAAPSVLAADHVYKGANEARLQYFERDGYGTYKMRGGRVTGEFNVFSINDLYHSGFFEEKVGRSYCEGEITFKFSRNFENVKVTRISDGGAGCRNIGKRRVVKLSKKGPPPEPQPLPKPENIEIKQVIAGGPACPQGTFDTLVTATKPGGPADFFEVIYDNFSVEAGPSIPRSKGRTHCTIAVDLAIPNGYQFSVINVHYEGFADIPASGKGVLKSEYFFPHASDSRRASTRKTINGQFVGDYDKKDSIGLLTGSWSPCGETIPLNMKSSLHLAVPQGKSGFMTVDQATGKLVQKWGIQWRRCKK